MTIAKPQTVNLLDTISAGYEAVNRRLDVLLAPILVNLTLWYSGFIPLDGLAQGLSLRLANILAPALVRERALAWLESLDLRLVAAPLNFVPTLAPGSRPGLIWSLPPWLQNPLGLAVSALLLNSVALAISGVYLAQLAEAVRGGRLSPRERVWQSRRIALVIGGASLAVAGVGLLLALPLLALSVIIVAAMPQLGPFFAALWYVLLFWVALATSLVPEAAAMGVSGPLEAIYLSVNLVRRNLAAILAVLALSVLIGGGFGSVFRYLGSTAVGWGPPLACVCSAYVSSGLAAARVALYRERRARWGR